MHLKEFSYFLESSDWAAKSLDKRPIEVKIFTHYLTGIGYNTIYILHEATIFRGDLYHKPTKLPLSFVTVTRDVFLQS